MKILTLPSLENERNTLPSWVVNPQCSSGIRGTVRVGWDRLVIKIARFTVGRDILTKQCVTTLNWRNCTENLDLSHMSLVSIYWFVKVKTDISKYRIGSGYGKMEIMDECIMWSRKGTRKLLAFSSRMSSASKETGRSIVRILRTCIKSKCRMTGQSPKTHMMS